MKVLCCYYFQGNFAQTHFLKNSSNIVMNKKPGPEMKNVSKTLALLKKMSIPVPLSPEFISRPFCLCVRVGSSSPFCFPSDQIFASVPLFLPFPLLNCDRPSPSWPLPFSKDARLKKDVNIIKCSPAGLTVECFELDLDQ